MARETKVGLLVGLAFIICFAVILANRGRQDTILAQFPANLLMNGDSGASSGPRSGSPGVDRGATTSTTFRPAGETVVDSGNRSRLARGNTPPPVSQPNSSSLSDGGGGAALRGVPPRGDSTHEPVSLKQDAAADAAANASRNELAERLDRAVKKVTESGADPVKTNGTADRDVRSQPAVSPPGRSHKIEKGDTLSQIALATYGTRSAPVVDAIYNANKGVLPSKHDLKVGVTLTLPDLPSANPAADRGAKPISASPAAAPKAATGKRFDAPVPMAATKPADAKPPAAKPPVASKRFYVVRENDRFASIAREQLGDSNRWKEIFDLNREKFPDPHKIRPGVRIEMPATMVASMER